MVFKIIFSYNLRSCEKERDDENGLQKKSVRIEPL